MKKVSLLRLGLVFQLFALCCFSCKNAYNNLIPNDEQGIIEFSVTTQDYSVKSLASEIKETYITVTVPKGTDVTALLPRATVSKQATLFPLTLRYFQEAFPHTDVLDMALKMDINPAQKSLENWFLSLYEQNPDFKIPPLVFPINFLGPVKFAVIGGQGGVEVYTVRVVYEDGSEPESDNPENPDIYSRSKKLLSFYVPNFQKDSSVITANTVSFTCKTGTDVRTLVPEVTVEEGSVFVPLTREYLLDVCTQLNLDPLSFAQGFMEAQNKKAYVKASLKTCDLSNLNVKIDKPIDFTAPIQAIVVGKEDKSMRLYAITATVDAGEAYLNDATFTKAKNAGLMKDCKVDITQDQNVASCTLYYPVEYGEGRENPYHLFLDAQFTGESLSIEYNGSSYTLGDAIPFRPVKTSSEMYLLGTARAKIHVENNGNIRTYELKLTFKEDPDTIRSITDFRFEVFYNPKIKALSLASITNQDDVGTIKATVLYSGDKPESLIPSFITGGGKVYVAGVEQFSKTSEQNFSAPLQYLCVSKDGNYERLYTVTVEFIRVEGTKIELKSFNFSRALNEGIVQDAIGVIDEERGTVNVDVIYSEGEKPFDLVAEFSATGRVSVQGITQASGFSSQNYKYDVYLKVTAFDDENVSKTYRVHVTFNFSTENNASLLRFYFAKKDNTSLTEDVEAYISERSGEVYATLPKGVDITHLVPSFEALGVVKVQGVEQASGSSAQDFTHIVEYVVSSVNGQNVKIYKVRVQVAGDVIFLNDKARGKNDGTTWKDAFKRLEDAIEACNKSNSENVEIWVASSAFYNIEAGVNKAVIIRGGFEGVESKKEERSGEKKTKFTAISFKSLNGQKIKGDFVFDSVELVDCKKILDADWDEEKWEENSICFEACDVNDIAFEAIWGKIKKLAIKNSKFDEQTAIKVSCLIPKPSQPKRKGEMSIEKTSFLSSINFDKEDERFKSSYACHLQMKDSVLASKFNMGADSVEFENVKEAPYGGKIELYHSGSDGKMRFKGVTLSSIKLLGIYLASYLFDNCEIPRVSFDPSSHGGESLEIKNCRGIERFDQYTETPFENATIENCRGKGDGIFVNARNCKVKDISFEGCISARNYNGKVNADIYNVRSDTLELIAHNDEGVVKIEDSRFKKCNISTSEESFLKNLEVQEKFKFSKTNAGAVKVHLNKLDCSSIKSFECEATYIDGNDITVGGKSVFKGEEEVKLQEVRDRPYKNDAVKVSVIGKNIILKQNLLRGKHFLLNIVALENFEFDSAEGNEGTIALYYPKKYTCNGKSFKNLKLLRGFQNNGFYFYDTRGSFIFNNCEFNGNFINERDDTVCNDCKFFTEDPYSVTSTKGSLKLINAIKNSKFSLLKIIVNKRSRVELLDSKMKNVSFIVDEGYVDINNCNITGSNVFDVPGIGDEKDYGSRTGNVDIKSSIFTEVKQFAIGNLDFDISNCTFVLDSRVLDTDTYLKCAKLNLTDCTFKKDYPYHHIVKGRILISTTSINFKNTKFIDTEDMCDVFMVMNKMNTEGATIENCTFSNVGKIGVRRYKYFLVKNSIIHGASLDLTVRADGDVSDNFKSTSKTLFENCDFFNATKPTTLGLLNRFLLSGQSHHYGPIAVKFEYDMSQLPENLKNKLTGTPTPQEIANLLIPCIRRYTHERIGFFINLGSAPPSNTSPAKFLGNYY